MKLKSVSDLYIDSLPVKQITHEFNVGEIRTDRLRCARCFAMHTLALEFVEISPGYGGWRARNNPHCRQADV